MHEAVIGLGGNLGSRASLLLAAAALLDEVPGLRVLARSRLYDTPPLGPSEHDFRNAALRVRWVGSAPALLDVLLHVEARLGRERRERWGARSIDLDLLWWSGGPVQSPRLCVPHPGLLERSFALAPLLDVLPDRPELAARLEALGGPPTLRGWPAPASLDEGPRDPYCDAAQALASAADGCFADLPEGQGPLQVLPWDATPQGPTLCAPLARALGWLRLGLVPRAAAVLDARGPRWRGLLLARALPDPIASPPAALPWVLKKTPDNGVAWLTLLPESV